MSEELKQEPPVAPKQKQFLLIVDELGMAFLGKVMPGIRYIEVEGMHIAGNDGHQFLVNPVQKPVVTPIETQEAPVA